MKKDPPLIENKSNKLNIFQSINILKNINFDKYKKKNIINNININSNNNEKNINHEIKNSISRNSFLNIKRERMSENEEINSDQNNIIKINLSEENNNKHNEYYRNHNEIIKSNIFEYDSNFEFDIKRYAKKYFWKNIIFRRFGGQEKLIQEIIKGIHSYNNNINEKQKISNYIIPNVQENSLILENNRLSIKIKEDNKNNYNEDKINKPKNQKNIDILEEGKKLLIEFDNKKELQNDLKFLKEFLYNENYFNENQIFFPENFIDENISNEIFEKNNILREINYLKLYAILKLVFPTLENKLFKKNIIYLEFLAYSFDKLLGEKYQLLINMIYFRIKNEVSKIKRKTK